MPFAVGRNIAMALLPWWMWLGGHAHPALLSCCSWYRVMFVHVLGVLPLCWYLARRMHHRTGMICMALAMANLLLMATELSVADGVGGIELVTSYGLGLASRSLVACLIALPWCLLVETWRRRHHAADQIAPQHGFACLVVCLIAAAWVPDQYIRHLVSVAAGQVEQALAREQIGEARRELAPLIDLRADVLIGGRPLADCVIEVDAMLERYALQLRQPLAATPSTVETLDRARTLAMVGETGRARRLLEPVATRDVRAALLLAAVLQNEGEFLASTQWYEAALDQLVHADAPRSMIQSFQRRAYDALAHNWRELGDPQRAEHIYQRALAAMPRETSWWQFQLGRHYEQSGRPVRAAAAFRQAADEGSADLRAAALWHLGALRERTPACLLRP